MNKTITYIIVTWNNEKEILNCLNSLIKYAPLNSQVIVVDNYSSDATVDIIKKNFSSVDLIVNRKNFGFAVGNNLALDKTFTKYVCFINPDVIVTEDFTTPSIDILEREKNIGLVSCRLKNLDGSWQPSTFSYVNSKNLFNEILHIGAIMPQFVCKKKYPNYYYPKKSFCPEWVIGAEMIMRTKEAKKIGGFSTEYYMYTEDMDLCKKIEVYLNKKIFFMFNHSIIHLGGASEISNVNYNKQKKIFENDLWFVEKFYGKREVARTKIKMSQAYNIRYGLLKLLYIKKDKNKQLERTKKTIRLINEI